ncbi:MAG: outer membrane beta-barrel protein [Hoeflea sp.]
MKICMAGLLAVMFVLPSQTASSEDFDWSGFYGGLQINYANGSSRHNNDSFYRLEYDPDGVVGGAHAGYRFNYGRFIFGPEVSVNLGTIEETATPLPPTLIIGGSFTHIRRTEAKNIIHAGGRVGYKFDRFLPSLYVGVVNADLESQKQTLNFGNPFSALFVTQERVWGFEVGAAIDIALTDSLSAGLSYSYIDLGSELSVPFTFGSDTEFKTHLVGARLSYRFP